MKKRRFIHYQFVLVPIVIVFTMIMTFTAKNNFTANYANQIGHMGDDAIPRENVISFVNAEILEPFMKLREADLGAEKGPCFDHELIFDHLYEEEQNLPFYKDQMIGAKVVERDCDRPNYIYTLRIYFDEKKVMVQTSSFEEWQTSSAYLEDYRNELNK